jgi:hypothetical protein
MADETRKSPPVPRKEPESLDDAPNFVRWGWWFLGGGALSFLALCAIVLFVGLAASIGMNAYLAWQLSGMEVVVVRPMPEPGQVGGLDQPEALVVVVTATPAVPLTSTPPPTPAVATSTPIPTLPRPTSTPQTVVTIVTATPSPTTTIIDLNLDAADTTIAGEPAAAPRAGTGPSGANTNSFQSANRTAAQPSNNEYNLIPIKDGRDPRPAEEHGDLNLKLREPQPNPAEATLIDLTGFDDAGAPKLSAIFKPNFTQTYTAHDWDWGCNCKGALKTDGYLLGIKTTPGDPIYSPPVPQDIYDGKYYATVLYAAEDTLTFVYNNVGTVADSYVIHYLGLNVDPNLLQLYRESTGNELPALTLDTPVGTANEELIVSVRDKGSFMDTRSRKDWWD